MPKFKFNRDEHSHQSTKLAIKCVYCKNSKIKLILDVPIRFGSKKRVYKYVTNTQELSGTDIYDYAIRYIYENLGVLPEGVHQTSHNGKECDSLIYDWLSKDTYAPSNFEQIRELFQTGKPLPLPN
tara:strand:+ start:227 stop:604 length:378 start_codon:yes stop_codon:yes gene_type:complete